MAIRVVPETKEDFFRNKNFMKKCSTKNMKESFVTGLTDTAVSKNKKKYYLIVFNFGHEEKQTIPFYGTRKSAEKEAEAIASVYDKNINYSFTINEDINRN